MFTLFFETLEKICSSLTGCGDKPVSIASIEKRKDVCLLGSMRHIFEHVYVSQSLLDCLITRISIKDRNLISFLILINEF